MSVSNLETAYTVKVVESTLNSVSVSALSRTLVPGNTLSARVLQTAQQQTTLSVAGKALTFDLPGHWSVGQQVQLTYLGGSPKPTFLLMSPSAGGQNDRVALSDTAQTLRDMAQIGKQSAETVRSTSPLAATETSATHIAAFLQNTVSTSGLFYESHLAAWSQNQWSTQSLLKEPQNANRLAATASGRTIAEMPTNTEVLPKAPQPMFPNSTTLDLRSKTLSQSIATYTEIADLSKTTTTPLSATLNSTSLQILGQQIQVLNQQQFVWTGQLWPGQVVTWMVQRRDGHSEQSSDSSATLPAQHWDSTLTLDLPRLGRVEAKIHLVQSSLHLLVTADQAALLREHWEDLVQSLQGLGLHVSTQQIRAMHDQESG